MFLLLQAHNCADQATVAQTRGIASWPILLRLNRVLGTTSARLSYMGLFLPTKSHKTGEISNLATSLDLGFRCGRLLCLSGFSRSTSYWLVYGTKITMHTTQEWSMSPHCVVAVDVSKNLACP